MPKQQQLTENEKKKIVNLVTQRGESIANVAREFKRSWGAIYYVVEKMKATGSVRRKEKLDRHTKRRIREIAKCKERVTIEKMRSTLALERHPVSISTIRRYLDKRGYRCSGIVIHPKKKTTTRE